MNTIARWFTSALLCLSSLVSGAAEINGIWSSAARSLGGLGSQWEFADGRTTYSFGAIVDFTYKVNGSNLETTFIEDGKRPEPLSQAFIVDGDTLTLEPNNAERRQAMKRTRGGASSLSVVGEWTYTHYTGGPAFVRYAHGGRGQLVVPMKTMHGTYTVSGGRILIDLPSEKISVTGAMDGESLSIRDEHGRETRFKRSDD